MYLTRFQLNPRRRGGMKLISSPHAMHAAVLAGFPDPEPTDEGRILWRLDVNGPRAVLYVVSPAEPDFTHLVEQGGWPSTHSWESKSYRPLLERIRAGQYYAFRLTANPVHSVRIGDATRGKPLGHVTVSQQEKWLLDRQERAGFSVGATPETQTMTLTDRRTLVFRRGEGTVTLRVASYEGTLMVTDRDRFVTTLTHGLGRARGYGCGLLTVAAVG